MGTDNAFWSVFGLGNTRFNLGGKSSGAKVSKFGITLIELVIVIAILAILIILSVANYNAQMGRARDARRKNDLNLAKKFLEEYYSDNNKYPDQSSVSCGSAISGYSYKFPCDPINNGRYVYNYVSSGGSYRYYVTLERSSDPDISTVGCGGGCGPGNGYNFCDSSPNTTCGETNKFGCINGLCVPVGNCSPNYSSMVDCEAIGCGDPLRECK